MARAGLDKQPDEVSQMFDGIAENYDRTNTVISAGQDRRWRKLTREALALQKGELVLDIAAGTGVSSVKLSDDGAQVVSLDFSLGMLQVGRQKYPDLPQVAGDAMHLPFPDDTFDALTISFGLRNVMDTEAGLAEILRVTKPGGRIVICEFSTPTNSAFRAVYNKYLVAALPKVAKAVSRTKDSYEYLTESISEWPDQVSLGRLMKKVGWSKVAYRSLSGGIVALHRAVKPSAED